MTVVLLKNSSGMEARVSSFGATLLSLSVADRFGRPGDVVLGFDSIDEYRSENPHYLGATLGRCAGVVSNGSFRLDGISYDLAKNAPPHHLHGGRKGFDRVNWDLDGEGSEEGRSVSFSRMSRDGEEGYPGNLRARVTYAITEGNELTIGYHATTDRPTIVHLAHHSCFNLSGAGDVLKHFLTLRADRFLPLSRTLAPTGESKEVAGTPFDFRSPLRIGARIGRRDEQLDLAGGYGHAFVLNREEGGSVPAATLFDASTGRRLEIFTTEPVLGLWTANSLEANGKGGRKYLPRCGVSLMPCRYPDAPSLKKFPSVALRPDESFESTTIFRFSTD